MTLPGRRLNKYNPRRSRLLVRIQKQRLADLSLRINLDVEKLTALKASKNENPSFEREFQEITARIKSNLATHGRQMELLALEMKGLFPKAVHEFITSIDIIVKAPIANVEESKLERCYKIQKKMNKLTASPIKNR